MLAWADAYRPLLDKHLEGAAFLPIPSDAPGIVTSLNSRSFWFSGVVQLAFPETNLFLTWEQRGPDIVLIPEFENRFFRYRLFDRINIGYEEPWGLLRGAQLIDVQTFTIADIAQDEAVAARHRFRMGSGDIFLWVCSGHEPDVGDGDDLFVSIEQTLPGVSGLVRMNSFGA